MANLRTTFPSKYLSRLALLEEVMVDAWAQHPVMHPQLFNILGMGKAPFVQTLGRSGVGQIPELAESTDVTYEDYIQGYAKKFEPAQYGLGIRFSKMSMDDDLDGDMGDAARQLGFSIADTLETVTANIFNNGFTGTDGPDSLPLFDTSHPLTGGGTEQNELSSSADLTVTSLEQALVDFMDTVDNKSKKIHIRPKTLLVPFELSFVAAQILGSELTPESANNALNPLKSQGLNWRSWEYLTDADAWFLLANKSDHKLRLYMKKRPEITNDFAFDSDEFKFKIMARWIAGWPEFRGLYGSPGA